MSNDPKLDGVLRTWSRNHQGIIGLYEASRLGASRAVVRAKLSSGAWEEMYFCVYRDTAVPHSPHQDLRAAFVATRGRGVVSHRSAAWLWGLVPTPPEPPELSVRPGPGETRRIPGITIHRSLDLDVTTAVAKDGVLVTNPMRTLVDLAGSAAPDVLTDALDHALARKVMSISALTAELDRLSRRGRPGVGKLRGLLLERGFTGAPAQSVLEAKMDRIIAALRLPPPTVELTVGDDGEYRLDFAWPEVLLAIEVDGYVWHLSPEHQRRDHQRRNHLQDRGWTLRIYTWQDVCHEPNRVSREISAAYRKLQAA